MQDQSIEIFEGKTGFKEFTTNHTELLLQDFKQKAVGVLNELKKDFVYAMEHKKLDPNIKIVGDEVDWSRSC